MAERKYYCFCAANCKWETMTKEQILTAIEQAVSTGSIHDIDSGFVTTLREINRQRGLRFWVGTTAEYNSLPSRENNVLYIKTDDNSAEDLNKAIKELKEAVNAIPVKRAEFSVEFSTIAGKSTGMKDIDLSEYGITGNKNVHAVVTLKDAQFMTTEFHCCYAITDNGRLRINVYNGADTELQKVPFNVCII